MNKFAVLVVVSLLSGCATVEKVALDPTTSAGMKGKSIVRTTRAAKPDFVAMTPTKGALGMLGAFAAISAGNELVKEHHIDLPADAIALDLGSRLKAGRGMALVAAPLAIATDDASGIAAAADGKADYVLDVQTTGWAFGYFPTAWGRYHVGHTASARVIDVASKKVVAQGTCARAPANADNTDLAPTYDDLMNNQALGLKNQLSLAASECAAKLRQEMLVL